MRFMPAKRTRRKMYLGAGLLGLGGLGALATKRAGGLIGARMLTAAGPRRFAMYRGMGSLHSALRQGGSRVARLAALFKRSRIRSLGSLV